MQISLRGIVFVGVLALLILGGIFFFQYSKFNDGLLHIVVCDVGQGDAIYIRTPEGKDIIFDGGPDNSVLSCLSNHMPFWDKQIELMILSHPHADHLNGLISVIKRYNVSYYVTERLGNNTAGFRELISEINRSSIGGRNCYFSSENSDSSENRKISESVPIKSGSENRIVRISDLSDIPITRLSDILSVPSFLNKVFASENNKNIQQNKGCSKVKYLYAGDKINFNENISLSVLAPTKFNLRKASPNGLIGDTGEFSSLIILLSFGSFDLLLTGDSQTEELQDAIESLNSKENWGDKENKGSSDGVEVLQVPHHGSKTGLNSNLLYQIRPGLAAISVGKKNKYGHPSKEVLSALKEHRTRFLRTDEKGEIEIISDGKKWRVIN